MFKRFIIIACLLVPGTVVWSQDTKPDSTALPVDSTLGLAIDTSLDYDDLLSDLDLFLDSILAPRSFFQVNLSAAAGYFSYTTRNDYRVSVKKKMVLSPLVAYYHKSGLGISVSSNMIQMKTRYSAYQHYLTPSFDFIQNRKWTGGVSYTRYITKDSLHFYTSPLKNEIGAYYLWRHSWLQPGFTANYGWGSRTDVKERMEEITRIIFQEKQVRRATGVVNTIIDTIKVIDTIRTRITTRESIVDFSFTTSLRHTFYWLALSKHNDYFKFTPMLAFSVGTQQFGFNRTTATT